MLASMLGISSAALEIIKRWRKKTPTTLMLNELRSFVGASSTSWKENKALCSRGKDVESSYRRGCSPLISDLMAWSGRRAGTVGGLHPPVLFSPASGGRAAGSPAVTGPPSRGWQPVGGGGGGGGGSIGQPVQREHISFRGSTNTAPPEHFRAS